MGSLSPIQIAVIVVSVVSLAGVIISTLRNSAMLAGYDEYKADIQKIATTLKAEMFRDGNDVVIPGNYKKFPIQVRFSYSENTPGLNIRMQAPVSFTFSVVPKGERATEGRVLVRTGDDMFDARFAARTDHPTQAKMLVSSKTMRTHMEKLCCSSKSFLTMVTGSIEVSELIIPGPYTARHVLDHVESMSILAAEVDDIPGAEKVKIQEYKREKSTPLVKIALVVGALVAIAAVFAGRPGTEITQTSAAAGVVHAEGVWDSDAAQMTKLAGWHAISESDFNADVVGWMRASGISPAGRIELDLDGAAPSDTVYCLGRDDDQSKRIVMLQNGAKVLDSVMQNVVGVVRIPKSSLETITWSLKPTAASDGDAVMIINRVNDKTSATILYRSGNLVISGRPESYQAVNLAQ
jgi:hypothetical protein